MLADTLDLSALKSDPRFQERDARKQNRNQLSPLIEEKLLQKSTTEWVDILNENSIPAGAILSLQEALVQEQIKHRQALTTVNEPDIGDIQLFNLAAKYSKTPGEITSPPPKHSQHTLEILEQLGLSTEEIKDLQDKKVIA